MIGAPLSPPQREFPGLGRARVCFLGPPTARQADRRVSRHRARAFLAPPRALELGLPGANAFVLLRVQSFVSGQRRNEHGDKAERR